jgi:hypothetical protein
MTKRVRVENADTSIYKVVVQIWDKGQAGQPDKMMQEIQLFNPCDMTGSDVYITNTRYLIVKEA